MDHAGDVAYKLQRGYAGYPWNGSDRVTVSRSDANRGKHVFVVATSDGGVFRVTVEQVDRGELSEEELYLDSYEFADNDPLRTPPRELDSAELPTHRLMPDGSLEPIAR